MSLSRDLTLYNGVSNRSRGWKSKRPDRAWPSHVSSNPTVMRWDGAARSSFAWDSLRRDPELWYRDGDCYVHLYGQGQSRRGPAFKVPLAVLLEADCYPLINRFIAQETQPPPGVPLRRAAPVRPGHPYGRTELYIPAPPGSDKQQAYQFHLATRNFFAFVFRRSLVGEHLGTALINLVETMQAFRPPQVDNFADLMSYMDEEGYLYFKCQPSHALAALHLAEVLHVRDLYIDAFAHCCGMSDQLFLGPEYQLLSSVTRKLLRRSRIEVELRLGQMGSMLKTFLQDELSEAHLGLHPGARAHLDRFRTLLYSVYASKFGFYPPASIDPRSTIFEIDVFRAMRADFDALFEYLVDTEVDPSQGIPIMAQGGICTLQSVQSFDARYKFDTLSHPLPLLPETQSPLSTKRVSWFGKQVRSGVHQRTATHHALLRATNPGSTDLLDNDLVRAYRRFEEDTVFAPQRADKQENLHPADARKVRWILIYATYQCLRQVTQPPPEVKDGANAPYHLCISTGNLPPWKDDRPVHSFLRKPTGDVSRNPSISTAGWSGATEVWTPPRSPDIRLEIKPDIDYLAIGKRDSPTDLSMTGVGQQAPPPSRRGSTMRPNVSRNNPVRRSFTMFNRPNIEKLAVTPSRRSSHYHEIVIHGYGNGMNEVEFGAQQQQQQQQQLQQLQYQQQQLHLQQQQQQQQQPQPPQRQPRLQQQLQLQPQPLPAAKTDAAPNASRSPSTSSKSSESNDGTRSEQSTASTGATSLAESSTAPGAGGAAPNKTAVPQHPSCLAWDARSHAGGEQQQQQKQPPIPQRGRGRDADPPGPRPSSIVAETTTMTTTTAPRWAQLLLQQPAGGSGGGGRQGALEKRRSQSMHAQYRKSMEPLPLNIRKAREDSDLLGPLPQQLHEEAEDDDEDDDEAIDAAAAAAADADAAALMLMMPVPTNPAALGDIKALMEVRASALGSPVAAGGDDIRPEWDMYGLGGLTEPKP